MMSIFSLLNGETCAAQYLKALRKQFFNAGGKKKKTWKSKQRRKAKRMAERFARLPAD